MVGEHVMLGLVHQPAEFLEPGPQLISATCRQTFSSAVSRSGWMKAWRMAAATTVSCVFGM